MRRWIPIAICFWACFALAEDLVWPPVPSGAKTTFLGFRLSAVDPGSVYDKAGLKAGDLVKSINGKTVGNADDMKELSTALERDRKVSVKIVREGKAMTLRYRILKAAKTAGFSKSKI